jgi:hypothetical protein
VLRMGYLFRAATPPTRYVQGVSLPNPGQQVSEPRHRLEADLAERYVLERELGRGGMAIVYLARDLKHKRPVALKVLHPDLAATLGPERFLREIQLAVPLWQVRVPGGVIRC